MHLQRDQENSNVEGPLPVALSLLDTLKDEGLGIELNTETQRRIRFPVHKRNYILRKNYVKKSYNKKSPATINN